MTRPRVAVVILTWNDGELLDAALASALASTGVDVEVVVVDNGSEPPATVAADPRVRLLRNEANRGVAAARNQGVEATNAPLVLFLDSDARLGPDTLEHLCRPLAASPDVALVAPVFDGQLPQASAGRAPSLGRKVARVLDLTAAYAPAGRRGPGDPAWDVDFAIGACQLVRRTAFDEVGGLDEDFFYGPEDVDFCLRLREAGWRVVQVAGAGCHHPPRRRHRRLLTKAGARHAWAVSRHLWRHRGYRRPAAGRPAVVAEPPARPSALDVVTVGYRSEAVIERCIRSARRIPGCASVVVVDHGDGGTAAVAARLGARTVTAPNLGFGAGQNRGMALCDSDVVLLLNPDAEVRPDAIGEAVALLRGRPGVAMVQGVIVNQATGRPERSAGVELRPVHLLGRAVGARRLLGMGWVRAVAGRSPVLADHARRVPTEPVVVESLAATAVLVRRVAFEEVGGFDPRYFLYGEDLDLCRRLRLAGWQLVAVPEVFATHASGGSAESSWARETSWWRGTMQFAGRWWAGPAWSVAVVAALLRCLRLSVRHPGRARSALAALVVEPSRERGRTRNGSHARGRGETVLS